MSLEEKMEPIMLPTKEATHLHKRIDDGILQNTPRPNNQNPCWERQHLCVCSDREIKKEDVVYHQRGYVGRVFDTNYNNQPEVEVDWFGKQKDITCSRTSLEYLKKVEASTDISLGLPNIPTEFIQEYVKKYNEGNPIREVNVEMEILPEKELMKFPEYPFAEGDKCFRPKLKEGNVIISKVEETWDDIINKFPYTWTPFAAEVFGWLRENYLVPAKLTK